MGMLFTKLFQLFSNTEHKVIIVGLDNAGKTTILYQFLMKEVVHTSPTIGSNVEEIVCKKTRFVMWDIGGQESLRTSWTTYYSNSDHKLQSWNHVGFGINLDKDTNTIICPTEQLANKQFVILVIDSTDRERLHITQEELYNMLQHEDLRKSRILVFANKQDIKGRMTAAEISQQLNLTSLKDHTWHIQACCGLTGEGLSQGLEWMLQQTNR